VKKQFLSLIPMLALLIGMTGCQQNAPEETVTPVDTATVYNPDTNIQTEYTIFLYGNAGGAMDNCVENCWEAIKPVLKDRSVRFVSCYKYGKPGENFAGKYGQPGMLTLFELTCATDLAKAVDDDSEEWPDFDMYDPAWLSAFINLGKELFPAKHYAFILYGHGGGFDATSDYEEPTDAKNGIRRAVIYDEWYKGTGSKRALSNKEFAQGIKDSDLRKMDCIFMHNCFMGNLESLTEVVGTTDYIITSAHPLAAQTDNILAFVKAIAHNQRADMPTILTRMMKYTDPHWYTVYEDKNVSVNGDLEALRLNEIPQMNKNIKRLSDRILALYPTRQASIDQATDNVYRYAKGRYFFDTEDYARLLAQNTKDTELEAIYRDIKAGFRDMMISRLEAHGNPNAPFDHLSLSIYLMDKDTYNDVQVDPKDTLLQTIRRDAYEQTTFHQTTGWGNWLNTNTQVPTNNPTGFTL